MCTLASGSEKREKVEEREQAGSKFCEEDFPTFTSDSALSSNVVSNEVNLFACINRTLDLVRAHLHTPRAPAPPECEASRRQGRHRRRQQPRRLPRPLAHGRPRRAAKGAHQAGTPGENIAMLSSDALHLARTAASGVLPLLFASCLIPDSRILARDSHHTRRSVTGFARVIWRRRPRKAEARPRQGRGCEPGQRHRPPGLCCMRPGHPHVNI